MDFSPFPNIRPAFPDDMPAVFDLCQYAIEDAWQTPSLAKCQEKMEECIEHGVLLVATEGDDIVGGFAAMIEQMWYTEEYNLREVCIFVHPNHRKSCHAKNLILAAKASAKFLGVPLMMCPHSTERTVAKCRLIGRHMTKIGELFTSE